MSTDTAEQTEAEVPAEAEAKPAKAKAVPTPCACGSYTGADRDGNALSTKCDAETVRTFGPGHDAKLKSLLIKVAIAGGEVTKTDAEGKTSTLSPVHAAEEFGFRDQVEKGLQTFNTKNDAREAKAKERADAKAEKQKAIDAKKAAAKAVKDAKAAHAQAVKDATEKANADKTPGPARAKVGRHEVDGEILQDGTFKFTNGKGDEIETDKFKVIVDPASVPAPTVDAN